LLMRPQLNGGTLIWNDGSSSDMERRFKF
jgi:hypothetical protein